MTRPADRDVDHAYGDALADGPVRGRGAQLNPKNRHETLRLHVLGEHLDALAQKRTEATVADGDRQVQTQVLPDRTRTIINRVDSPDVPFNWSINPYRGCEHGCCYCYARPDHERLGFSCGLDFETKILAKHDAPMLLRRELAHPRWQPETIAMSGVTDCYQPIERELRITRGCLEVMATCRQPVGIITKSRLVLRDLDLLTELAQHHAVRVAVSLTTLDSKLAATMEPRASSPADRLHTIARLREAGVPVTVMTAPIIPGLTDRELPALLKAAAEAGAQGAGYVLLRLPHQLKALFLDWLEQHYPERAHHVESLVRGARNGRLYDATPGVRKRGRGAVAEQIQHLFTTFRRRYGLDGELPPLSREHFCRPGGSSSGEVDGPRRKRMPRPQQREAPDGQGWLF